MKFTQIRNATISIEYNNTKFLIDPVLADKGAWPSFPNSPRQEEGNPLVELPFSKEKILEVDAVIVTHLHLDHFDEVAKELIPRDMKVFVQDKADYLVLEKDGFKNLEVLSENTTFKGISLIKTDGQHGKGEILKRAGQVCGIVFKHPNEKTLYVAGDTVWYEGTENVMSCYKPEIVVTNAGANRFFDTDFLIMGKEDLYELHKFAPYATIIASHMEAINHWSLSRAELKEFAKEKGFESNLLIPEDGESYAF
ncbi:MAG TPA: hypothetical protein DG753_03800 [Clostridium sp.]|nr:hypothetical protein [Clostridium sp.]